jgi:hypothetical protein
MEKINKNTWLFLGIVVALILCVVIYKQVKNSGEDALVGGPEGVEDVEVQAPAKPLSYATALALYKDKRIQLDQACIATPNNLTFKNNTKIMIDNRSDQTRAVKVGSTMSIKPWGFKIVTLSSATLPATWLVDCGASQNVATILIQK